MKRKIQYNKGVTRTDDCLVTSQSHLTMLTAVRISPPQFYIWQKSGCGIGYSRFVFQNGKLDNDCWDETQSKLFKFYWPIVLQRITMNKKLSKSLHAWNSPYTHETHQPNVAGVCIALNHSVKHKRKMAILGIKLTGK